MKRIVGVGILLLASAMSLFGQGWYESLPWNHSSLVSVELIDGKIHVTRRQHSMTVYPEGGGPPDTVYKEIYCASNGVIVLERKVEGKVIPPQTTPEKIEWPDVESQKVPPSPWQNMTNWSTPTGNIVYLGSASIAVMVQTNSDTNAVPKAKTKENDRGK